MGNFVETCSKNYYVWFVVLTNALSFTSAGVTLAWPSPSIPKLVGENSPIPVTSSEAGWANAMTPIGAVVMGIPYTLIFRTVGRKSIIVGTAFIYIAGWATMIISTQVWQLYLGRFLLGLALGPTYGMTPVYLGEVAHKTARGATVAIMVISQSIGCLLQYIVAPTVSLFTQHCLCITIPVTFALFSLFIPESPYYLVKKEKYFEATQVLVKLRGASNEEDVEEEYEDIKKCLKASPTMSFGELLKELPRKTTRKTILILTVITFAQNLSGVPAVNVYMQTIFQHVRSPIEPSFAVALAEICTQITVFSTLRFTDKFGRRPLLVCSTLVTIVSHLMIGLYFFVQSDTTKIVSFLGVYLIQLGYAVGLGPVPLIVMSEVCSFGLKGWLSGYYQSILGLSNAAAIKMFQIFNDDVGQSYSHVIFVCLVLGLVSWLMLILPETKNKSLQEIQKLLDGKSKVLEGFRMTEIQKQREMKSDSSLL